MAESFDHLRRAAGHAAGGAAEVLTPTYDRTRGAAARRLHTTLEPLYEQVRQGASNARRRDRAAQRSRRRGRVVLIITALAAAGAALGAAGALLARRRRMSQQWDEYEPEHGTAAEADFVAGPDRDATEDTGEKSSATAKKQKKMTAGVAAAADSVSAQAGRLADNLQNKSDSSTPPRS